MRQPSGVMGFLVIEFCRGSSSQLLGSAVLEEGKDVNHGAKPGYLAAWWWLPWLPALRCRASLWASTETA